MSSAFAYTHDNVGNRLSMTTPDGTHSYGYDDIYQLTAANYPAGYPFPDMTYYYDAAYNRTTTVNGGEVNYLSNNLNQYTSVGAAAFGYDDNGNLTGDGSQTYYYDVENRLTRVVRNSDGTTLGEYAYDPFGRRIVKEAGGTTTHYVYDHLSYQVLSEYEDGGGGFSQARRFVYGVGIDEPLAMETTTGGGGRYFYHRDGLGSVTNLTDETGQTSATYRYDVYGNFQLTGSAHGNPYIFTGRSLDEETGLYFYRARYYSPWLGRFLQVDPIRYYAGPNLYSYVSNSPVQFIDPYGLIRGIVRDVGKGIAGPGEICTADNCNKKKCLLKMLDEDDWKKGWLEIPDPGDCKNTDGVATPKGILKIPNGVTCTIRCDDEGKAKDIECKRRVRIAPDPEINPPDFPNNPFDTTPDVSPEGGVLDNDA